MLRYHVQPHHLKQHLWQVSLCFSQNHDHAFTLSLPNWVPGSYMIRDFARHIISIQASCNGQSQGLIQKSKNTWQATGDMGEWQVDYWVYAFDVSVRGAFLSTERGFFDGACLFLRHNQRAQEACLLAISNVPRNWDIATTLPVLDARKNIFQASNYRELIDHPVTMGNLLRLPFQAAGIEHEIIINGHFGDFDHGRLVEDVQRICTTEIALFDAPVPFERYRFLLFVGQNVYGGLEHGSSTALMADRHHLPQKNRPMDDGYISLLGLFSHEYFHAWNVKSIKPAAFADSDLNEEAYTRLLWAFEGITSYYDDLILARSGVISHEQYLNLLANTITRVQQGAGRTLQNLADASLTAWTKYYKQNENSPNAIVSYYQKGALAALCLDMYIRRQSQNKMNLDVVMRALYQDWRIRHQGLAENEWLQIAEAATGMDLRIFQQRCIDSTSELPLVALLTTAGVGLSWQALARDHGGAYVENTPNPVGAPADFGARFKPASLGVTLSQVYSQGSAEQAGLCAGDCIIALNQEIITDFTQQWARVAVNDLVLIHFVRDGMLDQVEMQAQAALPNTALLQIQDHSKLAQWLA